MPTDELPLLELFTQLREAGLPLGIGEYQLVLKAWRAGYGQHDRSALARLCRIIWVKSAEDARIFEAQFDRLIEHVSPKQQALSQRDKKRRQQARAKTIALAMFGMCSLITIFYFLTLRKDFKSHLETTPSLVEVTSRTLYAHAVNLFQDSPAFLVPEREDSATEALILAIEGSFSIMMLDQQYPKPWWKKYGLNIILVSIWLASGATWGWLQWRSSRTSHKLPIDCLDIPLALTQHMQDEVQVARLSKVVTTGDYFPVTRRQMKQSWRYLRRMVREGPLTELDMEATVQDIGRRGILLTPIFRARRVNRAEVLLLVDYDGSMVPFYGLSKRLVDTALQEGRSILTRVYYFHNCPVGWLYHDPYQQVADSIDRVLQTIVSDYVGVLIISDGGAAYGRWSPRRLMLTEQFLMQLSQQVRYVAWLNPMPQDRWLGTTAGEIAKKVPMLEFDRTGLDAAIGALRGKRRNHI